MAEHARDLQASAARCCAAACASAGFEVLTPKATFYMLVAYPKGLTSMEFVARLLDARRGRATPATGFGAVRRRLRAADLCADKARLAEAVERLESAEV